MKYVFLIFYMFRLYNSHHQDARMLQIIKYILLDKNRYKYINLDIFDNM